MKKTLFITVICLVVVVWLWFNVFAPNKKESDSKKQQTIRSEQNTLIKQELINKYQPNIDWEKTVDYSYQLEERLVNNKLSFLQGFVEDIYINNNNYYIKFSPSLFTSLINDFKYVAELKCNEGVIDEIEKHDKSTFMDDYYLIAKIESVTKSTIALTSGDSIEIKTPNLFILKGECVNIRYIDSSETI